MVKAAARMRRRASGATKITPKGVASKVKKSSDFLKNAAEKIDRLESLRENIAHEPIAQIARLAYEAASRRKRVEGATGINLMPEDTRSVAINSDAAKAINTSASMYMYRTPRRKVDDAVKYVMKRSVTLDNSAGTDVAKCYDINILDAKPVENNPNSDADYSRLTIEKAFDNYLLGKTAEADSDFPQTGKVMQSSIHVKSLSIELTFSNVLESGVMLDVYELVPQHTLGPSSYSSEAYASGYMSPLWTYIEGLSTTNVITTDNTLSYTNLAANPSVSTPFNRTWKKVKHLRLNMTGNSVHRHKSFYEINKTVSYPELAQFSDKGGKFAGWNPTFLVIQRGVPTASNQSASTNVRYSCNIQLNYEATPDRQNKVIVFDSNT